jgi:hypothetical protein
MYGLLIRLGGTLLAGVLIGWVINGWRLNASIASLQASYAQERSTYLEEVRSREKRLNEVSEVLRKKRDDEIKNLNRRLQSLNAELQQRQKRDSRESTDTAACSGATGAELSREDAAFLAWEASRADSVVENLNYCISQYNSIRKQ